MAGFTQRQWVTLVTFSVAQFCSALCVSIQAPFFPSMAEQKGAAPSQYGFVFGIYELVVFLSSPVYGRFINYLGISFVNNTGIFVLSVTCILFGFLAKMEGTVTFISFAFAIRIVEATGTSAFVTSAFSIIAREFPNNVGSTFATLETFFGIGLILGPTIGGILYELGGFMLPFLVVGLTLLVASFLILCLLPQQEDHAVSPGGTRGIYSLFKKPPIFIGALIISCCSFSIGFVQATLEPHVRQLNLTPVQLGLVFILNGATYALSAPLWGRICDNYCSPRSVCCVGAVFIAVSFTLIGPAPFVPWKVSLAIVTSALVLHGLGMGAELVATFAGFHKDSIALGFPNDINTYGLLSGLWTSAFALGAFAGPSLAGVLFDTIGFSWGSQTVVVLHSLLFLVVVTYSCLSGKKGSSPLEKVTTLPEEEPIIPKESSLRGSYGSLTSRDLC